MLLLNINTLNRTQTKSELEATQLQKDKTTKNKCSSACVLVFFPESFANTLLSFQSIQLITFPNTRGRASKNTTPLSPVNSHLYAYA